MLEIVIYSEQALLVHRIVCAYRRAEHKAKFAVAGYIVYSLYQGLENNPLDSVAHFAHLGGALIGFIILSQWRKKNMI